MILKKQVLRNILYVLLFFCIFLHANEENLTIYNAPALEEQKIDIQEEDLPNLDDIEDKNIGLNSEQALQAAKILKLDILTDLEALKNTNLYVGQYITIDYKLMLFDNAKIVYTEFSPNINSVEYIQDVKKDPLELAQRGEWIKKDDGFYISFTFKINSQKFSIPSLVVHVQNNLIQDKTQADSIELSALPLDSNKNFCGVIASNFRIINSNIQSYDDEFNALAIEIEAKNSNLEDLKLKGIEFQDLAQDADFNKDISNATLLLKLPKSMDRVSFSFFNIDTKKFESLSIQNVVNVVDNIENISPKNTFFSITNIIIIVFIALLIIITLLFRSYFVGLITIIVLVIFAYSILSKTHNITAVAGAKLTIQPTYTSTILFIIPNDTKIQAIDKKNGYYKVNVNSKIGWINHNDTK